MLRDIRSSAAVDKVENIANSLIENVLWHFIDSNGLGQHFASPLRSTWHLQIKASICRASCRIRPPPAIINLNIPYPEPEQLTNHS
jgi:hypothetical protein